MNEQYETELATRAHEAKLQAFYMAEDVERERARPFMLLRPKVFPDGDQWCALYGDDLKEGVAGFGDTPAKAAAQFDVEWLNAKARRVAKPSPECNPQNNTDEGQSRLTVGLGVIESLRTEADLCRNETVDDIADLLDKAADQLVECYGALKYLIQCFDGETWQCPQCGHAEETKTMDIAYWLREWFETPND